VQSGHLWFQPEQQHACGMRAFNLHHSKHTQTHACCTHPVGHPAPHQQMLFVQGLTLSIVANRTHGKRTLHHLVSPAIKPSQPRQPTSQIQFIKILRLIRCARRQSTTATQPTARNMLLLVGRLGKPCIWFQTSQNTNRPQQHT
jgi:hypothetical protein